MLYFTSKDDTIFIILLRCISAFWLYFVQRIRVGTFVHVKEFCCLVASCCRRTAANTCCRWHLASCRPTALSTLWTRTPTLCSSLLILWTRASIPVNDLETRDCLTLNDLCQLHTGLCTYTLSYSLYSAALLWSIEKMRWNNCAQVWLFSNLFTRVFACILCDGYKRTAFFS